MSDSEEEVISRRSKGAAFAAALLDSEDESASEEETPAQKPAAAPPVAKAPVVAPAKGGKGGKGPKGKKGGKGGDDDDDWALLDELAAEAAKTEAASKPAPSVVATAAPAVDAKAAAAHFLAATAGGEDGDEGADAKDKKKKKKKAKKAGAAAADSDEEAVPSPAPGKKLTGAAKAAQERLAAIQLAEEQAKKEAEELQRKEDAKRAIEEEEERKRVEKKLREKEKARLKKEKEMAEGTYMTKAQKEALARARARHGIQIDESPDAADTRRDAAEAPAGETQAAKKVRVAALYADAKKRKDAADAAEADAKAVPSPPAAVGPVDVLDDWETAAAEEDWETLATTISTTTSPANASAELVGVTAPPKKSSGFPYPKGVPLPSESLTKDLEDRIEDSRIRREVRLKAAEDARSASRLRSPICVVLGHVDTGKTSLLDYIRRTNVQSGEAGGITQQIGATYCPMDRLRTATDKLNKDLKLEYKIPGLLIIDTPGHESFVNLRSRGAGLCDIAVLVIDVMHGLERQTIESINLLRQRKTPFIVALNKVDRMYGWKANTNSPIKETLAKQADYAVSEFETRCQRVLTQLQEQGLNAKLYYENEDFRRTVSVVPTSAHTGEGIPDLLMLIVQLTQQLMSQRIMFMDYVDCNILEVKTIDGLGTTVDVVLVSGELKEGDTIVACGMDGPIVTQVRALLTPPPLREIRVKSDYVHHKRIEAAMGVKIAAQHLDKAVAGTSLLVAHEDDEIEDLKEVVMEDFEKIMKGFKRDPVGVYVQASTLGSLEALLEYLRSHEPPIPVASVNIGPLHKKDVVVASVMLEHAPEYAVILAFDVKVSPEARAAAEDLGVKVFTAEIIYHLTDQFEAYMKQLVASKQAATLADAVYPAICKIIPTAIFNKRDPIVVGVDVIEGKLKVGTPLCVVLPPGTKVPSGGAGDEGVVHSGATILELGRVASIEHNHTAIESQAAGGPSVAVKIAPEDGKQIMMYGRHFDHNLPLYARVTRTSIDLLKDNFRDEMTKENWKTVIKLKGLLGVE
jgi:translation initiation factor 5B